MPTSKRSRGPSPAGPQNIETVAAHVSQFIESHEGPHDFGIPTAHDRDWGQPSQAAEHLPDLPGKDSQLGPGSTIGVNVPS